MEDWTVEPWRWGCEDSDDGDVVWIEKQESTGQKEIPARAALTAEEIESLVGTPV